MHGSWIRQPTGDTAVLFVHGILSSGETCWRNKNGANWPSLLKEEAELNAVGIYLYTYETDFFSGTYQLSDVVDDLKERIQIAGMLSLKRLLFVCHSMGGIVVRHYLVERHAELIDRGIEVALFLVASPSLGSSYANWLTPLAKFMGHAQADVLRFSQANALLNNLDKQFQNLKESGRLSLRGKELIEDKFVLLRRFGFKQVVQPFSGARYFGEPYKVPQSDHFSIAKPGSSDAIQHRLLCQFIRENLSPETTHATKNGIVEARVIKGSVVIIGQDDEEIPGAGVTVSLKGVGQQVQTAQGGVFELPLPDIYSSGEDITFVVHKDGFRLFQPAGGETKVPAVPAKQIVDIKLLPKGSKRFLSDAQIEVLIRAAATESRPVESSTNELQKVDPEVYINDWAMKYGLEKEDVRAAVEKWKIGIQAQQNDPYKLGLAAFADKQFRNSSLLFVQSGEIHERDMEAAKVLALRDFRLAGDACLANLEFENALAHYQRALKHVPRESNPLLWAAVMLGKGIAHCEIGRRTLGPAVRHHMEEAIAAYRAALEVRTRDALPRDWATTQNNLGNVLGDLGNRMEGEAGARLLADAVAAYRNALEVRTLESEPQEWATLQNNLGATLTEQAQRNEGEAAAKLLAEAVVAFRGALEVRPRETWPQEWAIIQNNLGGVLRDQAQQAKGETRALLLAESVAAFRMGLEVRERETQPQRWAMAQANLGSALGDQGVHEGGEAGAKLLSQAVTALRAVLEVYTRESLPQQWATIQNNLGVTLHDQGSRTDGEAGTKLLGEAVTAFRLALEVRTRAALPLDWATTQVNLGAALREQCRRTKGESAEGLLENSTAAFRMALEVFTRESLPLDWAMTQHNLGKTLHARGERTEGETGRMLFADAVTALRNALEVYKRDPLPLDWAMVQVDLGEALYDQGLRTDGEAGNGMLAEAVASYRMALEVYTPEHSAENFEKSNRGITKATEALSARMA